MPSGLNSHPFNAMRLLPGDMLPEGTKVSVGNRRGTVLSCQTVQAQPCGTVSLHRIKLTEKAETGIGNRTKWMPLENPVIVEPNYSFVTML